MVKVDQAQMATAKQPNKPSGFTKLGRTLLTAALFCVALAAAIYPVWMGNTTAARYQDGQFKNIERAVLLQSGTPDVAFFGTSRTKRAIIGEEFDDLLEAQLDRPVIVYDIAVSGRGFDIMHQLFQDLDANDRLPKVAAIQLAIGGQKDAHGLYASNATWAQILSAPTPYPDSFLESASWRTEQLRRKLSVVFDRQGDIHDRLRQATDALPLETLDGSVPMTASPQVRRVWERLQRDENWRDARIEAGFVDALPPYGRQYLKATVDMLKRRNVKVVLFQVPAMNEPILSEAAIAEAEAYFGVDVFAIDPALREQIVPDGMADNSHLTWSGSRLYMQAFADTMSAYLN
jgi:hypothetical protein